MEAKHPSELENDELLRAFGWRMGIIPYGWGALAAIYHTRPEALSGLWVQMFLAVIILYTAVSPAEYLYWRYWRNGQ